MKNKVFTVYDSKAEAYLPPFLAQTKGQALRSFADLANDKSTNVGKYPEDFTLFELGEYDSIRGEYSMLQAKISLGVASEFVRSN